MEGESSDRDKDKKTKFGLKPGSSPSYYLRPVRKPVLNVGVRGGGGVGVEE